MVKRRNRVFFLLACVFPLNVLLILLTLIDRFVMAEWLKFPLKRFAEDMNLTECVLGMDQHGSHAIPDIVEEMGRLGIFPVFTPSHCTEVVSPVDHHVGARLKQKMATYYHAELDKNFVDWCKSLQEGGLHTWERRVLIAKWLADAWEEVKTDRDFMKAAFQ